MQKPNPSVLRDDVFEGFARNLQTCLTEHEECEKPNPNQLPTRLLLLDDKSEDRIFVHECKPEERGKYVALSYCWGTTPQVKLLKDNYNDFVTTGIEVRTLPKTIKDSILATRKLGLRYLWIDSLCIIQDSSDDKDKEIVGMANIYKNATITISAAAATDCGQGFLEDRSLVQQRLDASLYLPFKSSDPETRTAIDWVYLCPDPHIGHKVKRFSEEPISSRAWTYQETTLAPRLVIFGSGPPQWHCKGRWEISGLDMHPRNLPSQECTTTTMKITVQDGCIVPEETLKHVERPREPLDDIGLWLKWFPSLENYSRRALSFRADKLLALSALATEQQRRQNGTYVAGLWSESLPRSLLWRRWSKCGEDEVLDSVVMEADPKLDVNLLEWLRRRLFDSSAFPTSQPGPLARSHSYIAPTWSPMSSTVPIQFEAGAIQEDNEFHTSLVEIHNRHVDLTTKLNPYGQLNFAYLDVTAPMCRMSWQELTANFLIVSFGEPFQYWDYIIPDDQTYFKEMCQKYPPSFNPQILADMNTQDSVDEGGASILITDNGTRVRLPIIPEPASRVCRDADVQFDPVPDVKKAVIDALLLDTPVKDPNTNTESQTASESQYDNDESDAWIFELGRSMSPTPAEREEEECEFYLFEVERSMSPAGLVLKRVHGDIFARVGYFAANSNLDPEIVCLTTDIGTVQVRGRKDWNWGQPSEEKSWTDGLERRGIILV